MKTMDKYQLLVLSLIVVSDAVLISFSLFTQLCVLLLIQNKIGTNTTHSVSKQ